MLINELKLVQLFCEIDDFTQVYEQKLAGHLLPVNPNSKYSSNKAHISLSEMMTLEILYHLSGHKCFEYFYRHEVLQGNLKSYFPAAPSYNRFVELKPRGCWWHSSVTCTVYGWAPFWGSIMPTVRR